MTMQHDPWMIDNDIVWIDEDYEPVPDDYTAGFAEGRAEGLRDAWHLLVAASSKGQSMTEAIQKVYWAWKEAAE